MRRRRTASHRPATGSARLALLVTGLFAALIVLVPAPASAAPAPRAADEPGAAVRVAIKPLDPFVTRRGDTYSGFSIELWNEIARRNRWTTTYVWHDTVTDLLDDVRTGGSDAGIAGISITRDREQVLDFSYPMFGAGLQVMTGRAVSPGWTDQVGGFVTAGVGPYLAILVLVLVVAGHVVWLSGGAAEQRGAPERRGYLRGVGLGMFKAAGVGLAGDFGVGEPTRPASRLVAVVWSIVGVCFVSLLTAAVTTQLTVQSIQSGVTGVQDLAGRRVVTVSGTTAATWLRDHDIAFRGVGTIDEAYPLIDDGTADAVVFDAPVLARRAATGGQSGEVLVGGVFDHEDYGIAFPTGSPLRKKVNTTLLDMQADGTYDDIYEHYFGSATAR